MTARDREPRAWGTWNDLRKRCNNKRHKSYPNYGGRGIRVCKRWDTFAKFFADMGSKPQGMTIERINNDRGYSKANCRWATHGEQMRNTRANRKFRVGGRTWCVTELERDLGLSQGAIWHRLRRGWSVATATATPKVFHGLQGGP